MFMTIFFWLWNIVKNWMTPKVTSWIALSAVFLGCLGGCYVWGYKNAQRASEKAYKQALEQAVVKAEKDITATYEKEKELLEKQIQVEVKYIDRVKVVEKIVEKKPSLNSQACAVEAIDVKAFNESLKR